MKNRDGHTEHTRLFIGKEVEHTPAYQMDTLFVIGLVDPAQILEEAKNRGIEHIYLGANQSFNVTLPSGKSAENTEWNSLVKALIDEDFWVTLDYDIKYHNWVIESGYNDYDRFISLISVKLPHIQLLNYNACVKIDDTGFRDTNPGVWVHSVHNLTGPDTYTDWSKYTKDEVIE